MKAVRVGIPRLILEFGGFMDGILLYEVRLKGIAAVSPSILCKNHQFISGELPGTGLYRFGFVQTDCKYYSTRIANIGRFVIMILVICL